MIHILRPEENLEEIRQTVASSTNRPVLVVGAEFWQGSDSLYRLPGQSRYCHIGRLELFLSLFSCGDCVKVHEKSATERVRYFNLISSQTVRLIYPLYREEKPDPWANPHFKEVGVGSPLNGGVRVIFLTPHDRDIPQEIQPFVVDHRGHGRDGGYQAPGVKFAVSNMIERPVVLRPQWHTGVAFEGKSYTAQTLQAPGHYSSESSVLYSPQAQNRMCLVDAAPGGCVRCGGSSGHRAHLAVVVSGNPSWPDGMVCRGCYPEVSREWGELLATWSPPEKSQTMNYDQEKLLSKSPST